MRDDRFEWDDRKAAANLRKHDLSFELARLVFDDQMALDDLDDEEDEERFVRVGMANGELLYVVYALRGVRTRIISARKANRNEQIEYFRLA
jgi:uncharacterized protein